jgi:hypothetical protein
MTDSDDLFEFGDLDDDSLEIDLDELFGDLEMLSLDVEAIEAASPVTEPKVPGPDSAPVKPLHTASPAQAAPAPQVQPVAAAGAQTIPNQAAPAVQPIYQQPVYPGQAPQPIGQSGQAYMPPGAQAPTPLIIGKYRVTKATAAVAFATIITLANVAVTMVAPKQVTPATQPAGTVATTLEVESGAPGPEFEYERSNLQGQIDTLNAQLLNVGTPVKPIPASYREGDHPAFDDVADYIEMGLYPAARERLYGLLAIIDRFDTHQRDAIEAKASYLLADSWRLEAVLLSTEVSK